MIGDVIEQSCLYRIRDDGGLNVCMRMISIAVRVREFYDNVVACCQTSGLVCE